MIYVGIDWADKSHYICILDQDGKRLESFQIPHNRKGFDSFHNKISQHGLVSQAKVAIETKDSLLVDFLLEKCYQLFFMNPKQTDSFRDRHRMSSSKSDAFDAFVLADAVRTDPHLLHALEQLDEVTLQLRVLTRTREGVVGRKVAVQNELTADLKRYFPLALELFGGVGKAEAIAFLMTYPSYEQAKTVTQTRIKALLIRQTEVSSAVAARHAEKAYALLRDEQAKPQASIGGAYPTAVKSLLRQLKSILEELRVLDEEIAALYRDHPNKDLLDSLPGIADKLGPVLAGEIGCDVSRFQGLKGLKAFAGVSPVTGQSGKYKDVYFRRACNHQLRRALHLASMAALNSATWARDLYDRLKREGKSHARALRAVGEQLMEMIYAILLRGVPYDENYHMQMRAIHGRAKN